MATSSEIAAGDTRLELGEATLIGQDLGAVRAFRGLVYARARRFEAARAFEPKGRVEARLRGPQGVQAPTRLTFVIGPEPQALAPSETPLVLSVFAPREGVGHPVMVFYHGGAYVSGAGGESAWYDGHRLAAEQNVVVVCVSYRLGAFGWASAPRDPGLSPGLTDQIAALNWVRRHIGAFGGDADNLTLFGQSAGAHSVQAMLEVAPGRARRAIIQSSPCDWRLTTDQAARVWDLLKAAVGGDPAEASAEALLQAQGAVLAQSGLALPFSPLYPPPAAPGPPVDILIGHVRDDGRPYAMMAAGLTDGRPLDAQGLARGEALTDSLFGGPARRAAQAYRAAGCPVTAYRFDWRPRGSSLGAAHCVELPLLLGDQAAWSRAPILGEEPWAEVDRRGRALRAAWAAFARHGSRPAGVEDLSLLD